MIEWFENRNWWLYFWRRKIGGTDIPADAEISAELLAALQSDDITADDIEMVWDEATGKMIVRLKSSYLRKKAEVRSFNDSNNYNMGLFFSLELWFERLVVLS